jgi:nucleotide-binding universal stress UspA family protein
MLSIRTILHPTDLSSSSDYAFRLACSLARGYGARPLVVHVAKQPVITPVGGVVPPEPEQYQEELTGKLHQLQVEAPHVPVETRLLPSGDPARAIPQVGQEAAADLIVMGTHGRQRLRRLLTGSVAEAVLRAASCPVLMMRSPFSPAQAAVQAIAERTEKPLEVDTTTGG